MSHFKSTRLSSVAVLTVLVLSTILRSSGAARAAASDENPWRSFTFDSVARAIDHDSGRLWIGTGGGVLALDVETSAFDKYTRDESCLPSDTVHDVDRRVG